MNVKNFFKTPIYSENKPEFLKSLNKASDKYIKKSKSSPMNKAYIKKFGDFGTSYHSTPLTHDNDFLDFKNYIGEKCFDFLDEYGFDMQQYRLFFTELWVQEFSKKGGGHHNAHVHWNQHVSGFYFLKCSDKTSYPVFHEPRTGARATKLQVKKSYTVNNYADELVYFKPRPGDLIIFPGYLEHEFVLDHGIDPFRFIHFNLQAILKGMAKDDI